MIKCKRNILLIFGFLLIVNLLFVPCNKIHYSFHYRVQETEKAKESDFSKWLRKQEKKEKLKEKLTYTLEELLGEAKLEKTRRVSSEYVKVFFPLVISRANKYRAYVKWESSVFLLILEKKNEARTEKEINEIYQKKIKEFHEKFGYDPYHHRIWAVGFFIELGLLILIGSLSYIFFCVVLRKIRGTIRKIRGTMREVWRDAIKRRKIGVVLILTGIGVPMVLVPFIWHRTQISRWEVDFLGIEFLFKYPLMIGIILFLIGAGMVIFSFFPKDVNPKK